MHSSGQRGSVLIVILVVTVVLAGASVSLLTVSLAAIGEAAAFRDGLRASYAAESGVSASIAEITSGCDYDGDGLGNVSGTLDGLGYCVTATSNGDRTWTIVSEAAGGWPASLEVTVRRVPEGLFTRLAFGAEGATVTGNTVCDSYDSAKGTYASQVSGDHAGENGDVASNGDIRVSGAVKVYGDATPGPGCTVTGSGYVHGSTAPAEEEAEVAVYSYAPEGESPGELDTERTLAGGTYRFSSIKLASNDTLYLGVFPGEEVTVYVDEHIRITANARIVILDGVKVVIHHGGTPGAGIVLAGRGVVNESGAPARLLICSATAGNLVFAGSSDFHGAVLAPLARVRLTGTSAFYGAVVARETDITCARAHYDEALAYPETGGLTPYGSVSWRVLK